MRHGGSHLEDYALGHSDQELERLAVQARLLAPMTERFLAEAGLSPGMRVLDVGSGMGDVSLLASKLVGSQGEVVGVDLSSSVVAAAARRQDLEAATNVSFIAGDASRVAFDRSFDAVVGRYVLMYQQDPSSMLRDLASKLRPGGVMMFHELDWGGARSFPPIPLFDRCCRWVIDGLKHGGAEAYMGTKLRSAFEQAGLPTPVMRLEAVIGGADDPANHVRDFLATLFPHALGPLLEKNRVVAEAAIDPATLERRLMHEVRRLGSVIVGRSEVGAWTRR